MNPELQALRKELEDLRQEFYLNNFSAQQDFSKRCHFNTRIRVPVLSALPATCEIGELCVHNDGGGYKLYYGSALNTWTATT